MDPNSKNYLLAILVAGLITYLITFIELWQLIIIPGLMAGIICYEKPRKGIYGGAIGIAIVWISYIIFGMLVKNTYTSIDQFAGVIFGSLGFGWIIVAIILLLGILFGALGGAIGAGTTLLIKERQKNDRNTSGIKDLKPKPESALKTKPIQSSDDINSD